MTILQESPHHVNVSIVAGSMQWCEPNLVCGDGEQVNTMSYKYVATGLLVLKAHSIWSVIGLHQYKHVRDMYMFSQL